MIVLSDKMVVDPQPLPKVVRDEKDRQVDTSVKLQKRDMKEPIQLREPAKGPDPRWEALGMLKQ